MELYWLKKRKTFNDGNCCPEVGLITKIKLYSSDLQTLLLAPMQHVSNE